MTGTEGLLTLLLDCGTLDLKLLDDVQYDWSEIISPIEKRLGLNELMWEVVHHGFSEIDRAVTDRISELETDLDEGELDDDGKEELEALKGLFPYEDFSSYHNYLDTHVYCERHGKVYEKYMSKALEEFEENTGLPISIDDDGMD